MKKTILILTLVVIASYSPLAEAVTYDSSKEIIKQLQRDTKHN